MKRLTLWLCCLSFAVSADEGMWTYNNFPSSRVQQKYGFTPTQSWLDHVRLSSARLAGGCSGSFVSPNGLVMTNHHCAHDCIEQLSTAQKDFVASGFYAKTVADEVRCPEIEINQLLKITNVTAQIGAATRGLSGQQYKEAQLAATAKIEKDCATSDALRCEVVPLYHGGEYDLYQYRRFSDVRLVFAPEFAIAFFGGDPDNFEFPRYDLDVSFLRVYDNGKPAQLEQYLPWNTQGAKEGDLTFVSGNPGQTSRLLTVAELEYERDVYLPRRLFRLAEQRGMITEFQKRGPEQKRHSTELLFGVENSYKGLRGRLEALLDKGFFQQKLDAERRLREKVARKPQYAHAWDAIAQAEAQHKALQTRLALLEGENPRQFGPVAQAFDSDNFKRARLIVRFAEEIQKPNEQRLKEYGDSKIPALKQEMLSTAPLFDDFEIARLTLSLTQMREKLGADDPFVRKVLGKQSPAQVAQDVIAHTRVKDVAFRKQLVEGGKAAIDSSNDPLIRLVELTDPDSRAVRKKFEDEIESVLKKNDELVAKATFEAYGTSTYPDATFTLRLSYGQVKGYNEGDRHIAPITVMAGAFDRATGQDPFALPQSWLAAQKKIAGNTPMDFVTDNDIIGGNSGSPVVSQQGEAIGLVFDGNIESLAGEYGFDPALNRTVAVSTAALTEALDKIYGAQRVLEELRGGHGPAAGSR